MNPLGNNLDYLSAFIGGVFMSLTPCVYPLIPVIAGYIGVRAGGSKLKGFTLSLAYVTGAACVYSALGLFASLTGTLFGRLSLSPITRILAGAVIILFGLSMLDLFRIEIPGIIKPSGVKKEGYIAVFLLGLISGLVASPCVTPVLFSILAYLATKKNLLYGTTLLFVFAYGMGLIFILAGTFSSVLVSLPKSGKWMVYIKRICAFILIGTGLYFIILAIGSL